MAKPTTYPLGTAFGRKGRYWAAGYHTGVDYLTPTGSSIVAAIGGKVIHAGRGGWGAAYGIHVVVESRVAGRTYRTIYAHLASESVSVGQVLATGQALGRSNSTGNVTGPHLHMEVRVSPFGYWQHVNPKVILSAAAVAPVPAVQLGKFHAARNTYAVTTKALPLTARKTPGGARVGSLAKGGTFVSRGWLLNDKALWIQRDSDGAWFAGTYLDLVPAEASVRSWFGKVISKNIGWMNDTGKAKAKSAAYRQSVVDDLVEMKPFAIAVQELLGTYLADMDRRFAKAGYVRSGGSDGRYVYFRKGTKVLASGVWDLRPRYNGDDRQAAYVLLDAPSGAVLVVSAHLDHSDPTGETQVRQAEDVTTRGEALLKKHRLPIHRGVYCMDTNSRGRVREAMTALSYYDTARDVHRTERVDNPDTTTFPGWDGEGGTNIDGIWLHTDRPCVWSGIRRRNDHLSDHRAVVADPGLITAA